MKEQSKPPENESPAPRAERVADKLAKLREAQFNLANQELIAKRIEEYKRVLLAQIEGARRKVGELERDFQDDAAHRRLVEGSLQEELRLAELPFRVPMLKGTQIGPRPKE